MRYPIFNEDPRYSTATKYIDSHNATNLPYLIEGNKWQPVDNLRDCDIIPIKGDTNPAAWPEQLQFLKENGVTNKQLLVMTLIWDDCDTYDWANWYRSFKEFYMQNSDYRMILLHNNKCTFNNGLDPNEQVYYDHLWNRSKAYYTDFNRILPLHKIYTYSANIKSFALDTFDKMNNVEHRRIFLTPNRIYPFKTPRAGYRKILKQILTGHNGYMSDPTAGIFLNPEQQDLIVNYEQGPHGGGGTYHPIANEYYKQSYVSIYVETLVVTEPNMNISNPFHDITEKTYDALIKGHFILPFGYKGLVRDIRDIGFELPDWIDYSYDEERMDILRFAQYIEEVKRLLTIPLHVYNEHFLRDIDILKHNRELFWTRPYDPLHDKLVPFLQGYR